MNSTLHHSHNTRILAITATESHRVNITVPLFHKYCRDDEYEYVCVSRLMDPLSLFWLSVDGNLFQEPKSSIPIFSSPITVINNNQFPKTRD